MAEHELQAQLQKLQAENVDLQKRLSHNLDEAKISAVSLKLPTFWPDKPSIWFAQVEAQFQIANIVGDTTKYNYVVGHLDQRLAGEVEDIIINPPKNDKYEKLKELLIQRLSISQEKRVRQLLSDEELGDRKPSQFLRHLRSLAGSTLSDDNIIRQLWLRRLPQQAQAILAAQADLGLDKIAELADKIIEVAPTPTVCATSAPPELSLAALAKQLEEVSNQVAALSRQQRRPSRDRSTSSNRSSSNSKRCWYHRRWGTKANTCISPCDWKENENNNQ